MTDSFVRFSKPQKVPSLKEAQLWSLEFSEQTDFEFRFYIMEKLEDGYMIHGHCDTVSEAFRARKQLAAELGAKLFLRARRIQQTVFSAVADDDGCLDRFKDWFAEGVSVADVDRHLRRDYMAFCRSRGRSAN